MELMNQISPVRRLVFLLVLTDRGRIAGLRDRRLVFVRLLNRACNCLLRTILVGGESSKDGCPAKPGIIGSVGQHERSCKFCAVVSAGCYAEGAAFLGLTRRMSLF